MKRTSVTLVLMVLGFGLSLGLLDAAGWAAERAGEPMWMADAREQLDQAYPAAGEGMVRYVHFLEPKADESRFRVELIVGKVVETDGVNRYGFGGQVERETVQGWGYTKYVVSQGAFDNMFSTQMGVPPGQPKVNKFVTLGGEPMLVRYNSKLPVVVYVPAGGEVRYRIWEAPVQADAMPLG